VDPSLNPLNNLLYVANSGNNTNTVSVINATKNSVIDTIKVGNDPVALAINPNNNLLYVAHRDSNIVFIINCTDNTIMTINAH
jgi:YVTN family beta-propeller protein